jgi:hypothetical protein
MKGRNDAIWPDLETVNLYRAFMPRKKLCETSSLLDSKHINLPQFFGKVKSM